MFWPSAARADSTNPVSSRVIETKLLSAFLSDWLSALRASTLAALICAVTCRKAPLPAFDLQGDACTKCAAGAQRLAGGEIEFAHFVVGVSQDDVAVAGFGDPLAIPGADQVAARGFEMFCGNAR
ncbi:MAG: hypothetical protein ACKOPO_08525 [Novosphingobium sp.]